MKSFFASISFKMASLGLLIVATIIFFFVRWSEIEPPKKEQLPYNVIILQDSISTLNAKLSTIKHENIEIIRQRDLALNSNASLLTIMQSINSELSRQHQDSSRVRY